MRNRSELRNSEACGCFYCEKVFSPTEITDWVDDGETPMCPYCGIDSVLASASGFQLSKHLLQRMNAYWFRDPLKG